MGRDDHQNGDGPEAVEDGEGRIRFVVFAQIVEVLPGRERHRQPVQKRLYKKYCSLIVTRSVSGNLTFRRLFRAVEVVHGHGHDYGDQDYREEPARDDSFSCINR